MSSLSRRDTLLTLTGVNLALFLGALDQTVVATALPQIVEELSGLTRYAWVSTSYLVASTVMVPIVGKLADTYCRKTIELFTVGLFIAASTLCGFAGIAGDLPLLGDGMSQLILFRALQGLAGAGLFAMAFIVISDLFPPAERGRYTGLVSATWAVAALIGPFLGGFLADEGGAWISGIAGWRWVFLVNLPVGLLAYLFIARYMPSFRPDGRHAGELSLGGSALLIIGLVPLILALQLDKIEHPWTAPLTLALLGIGSVGVISFVLHARHAAHPILNLGLFENRVFRNSIVAVFFYGSSFLSLLLFLPLYMVNVLGISAKQAGLALIPMSVGVSVGAWTGGQIVARWHRYRWILVISGAVALLGQTALAFLPRDSSLIWLTAVSVLCGVGLGPGMPLIPLAVQNAVTRSEIGQATSACQFFRQIGGAAGTALLGAILVAALLQSLPPSLSLPTSDGAHESPLQGGVESARAALTEKWDAVEKSLLAQWESSHSPHQSLEALPEEMRSPSLEASLLQALEQDDTDSAHALLIEAAETEIRTTIRGLEDAFHHAVTTVFRYVLLLTCIAWGLTFMIPEIPLRKNL